MDVQDRALVRGALVERPVALVGERRAADVRKQHEAGEAELVGCAVELGECGVDVVERQRAERGEAIGALRDDLCKRVVDHPRQWNRAIG